MNSDIPIGIELALPWFISIQLVFNWQSIDCHLASDWISIGIGLDLNWHPIDCQLTSDWISIGIRLDFSQSAFSWQSMGIPFVVKCHSIVSQLAHWRQIGRLQIRPTPQIWPKPRLLIGRELEMLASHWSRGPSESFQRGYPYDPEPEPIEHF